MDIEVYPDITADQTTWPVLCRTRGSDGEEVVAYDPGPYHRKQKLVALVASATKLAEDDAAGLNCPSCGLSKASHGAYGCDNGVIVDGKLLSQMCVASFHADCIGVVVGSRLVPCECVHDAFEWLAKA